MNFAGIKNRLILFLVNEGFPTNKSRLSFNHMFRKPNFRNVFAIFIKLPHFYVKPEDCPLFNHQLFHEQYHGFNTLRTFWILLAPQSYCSTLSLKLNKRGNLETLYIFSLRMVHARRFRRHYSNVNRNRKKSTAEFKSRTNTSWLLLIWWTCGEQLEECIHFPSL